MGSQGCFPCRIPKAAPNCPQSKKGLGSGPVLLVQSRVYLGLVLGLWGYLCAHSPVSPPVTPTGGGATATALPGLCLTVGEKTSWNGLGKLPALPKRKDPQHLHPSLHIPLPVCGRNELPPCPCSPKMILFPPIYMISLFHHETNPNQVNLVLSRRRRQSLCGPGNSPDFISFLSKGLFGIRPFREGGVA